MKTEMTREKLKSIFDALRNDPSHHLGLGDIRLTIAQQDEILNLIQPIPPVEGASPSSATAEEYIRAKHPQDWDDIPQWHKDELTEFAALAVPEAIRKLSPTNEQIKEAALVWANHHSEAPDKDCPDWLIHDYEAGAYFVRECYGVLNKVAEATKDCYPKEFVGWPFQGCPFIIGENGAGHIIAFRVKDGTQFTIEELFNYWKENEQ